MRLFVGIPLPDAAAGELAALVRRIQSAIVNTAALRWTTPDSWHITLQFLGSATAEQLDCLKSRLAETRTPAVLVKLSELGCFDRAGVLFVDVSVTPQLAALQRSVVASTGSCGFVADTRPFHPHITLARRSGNIRTRGPGSDMRALVSGAKRAPTLTPFTAREIVLFESRLGSDRAHYQALLRVPLGSGPASIPGGNR